MREEKHALGDLLGRGYVHCGCFFFLNFNSWRGERKVVIKAYKTPARKIAETPSFFLKDICRFHMTLCGTINIDRFEALLKEAVTILIVGTWRHRPSIHGFQNFSNGSQGKI